MPFILQKSSFSGRWFYSDPCPVVNSKWAIVDLHDTIIQDYMTTPGNGYIVYNDELILKNNFMYFIKLSITDAVNRSIEATSDGVVIVIQPPGPGHVRDGLTEDDIDYQESVTELSANWESFGDGGSSNPSQVIHSYEVAIGDNHREQNRRTNIHYFENVGLNTTYTFTHLNLTAKTVTYYITVRAYSIAGAFTEEYSNGVKVGFKEGVISGTVAVNQYQHNTDEIAVFWKGFESDVGIKQYNVGISTAVVIKHNGTFPCSDMDLLTAYFDVRQPVYSGLDTYKQFINMSLKHTQVYFVTVFASDVTNLCASATSDPILIDTTAPDVSNAQVFLNHWYSRNMDFVYVQRANDLMVTIKEVQDFQSGIEKSVFKLMQYASCPKLRHDYEHAVVIQEVTVKGSTEVTFFNISIVAKMQYSLQIYVNNNAGLSSVISAPVFSLDTSAPMAGSVKIASDWQTINDFQSSTTSIKALTAIAWTNEGYDCPDVINIFPNQSATWISLSEGYTAGNVYKTELKITLHIGYNIYLTEVLKSGIRSDKQKLKEGIYSFKLSSAKGTKIITTLSLSTKHNYFPKVFTLPLVNETREGNYESMNDTLQQVSNVNESTTTVSTATNYPSINSTENNEENLKDISTVGFGIHILGERQDNNSSWKALFWAADIYSTPFQWVELPFDPSSRFNVYEFELTKQKNTRSISWNIKLKVNGIPKAAIDGIKFEEEDLFSFVQTWNKDGYEEQVTDPFKPFRTKAELIAVTAPFGQEKECLHGKGFYDGESGIVELWAGVSDSVDLVDNIKQVQLYKTFCIPCREDCDLGCDHGCQDKSELGFNVIDIYIDGLSLIPTTSSDGYNATVKNTISNSTSYYVTVKMVNQAGQSTFARSNPVMVDNTPPFCVQMECTDPLNSGPDQPTAYVGSNSTIGAYWDCEENLSEIQNYVISVGKNSTDDSLYSETNVYLKTNVRIELNYTTFKHAETYFVNLKVLNTAGMENNYFCQSKVILTSPDVSKIKIEYLYSDLSRPLLDGIRFSTFQDRIGISWDSPIADTEFYGTLLSIIQFKKLIIFNIYLVWFVNHHYQIKDVLYIWFVYLLFTFAFFLV